MDDCEAVALEDGTPIGEVEVDTIEVEGDARLESIEVAEEREDALEPSVGAAKTAPLTESSVSVIGSFIFETGPPGKV